VGGAGLSQPSVERFGDGGGEQFFQAVCSSFGAAYVVPCFLSWPQFSATVWAQMGPAAHGQGKREVTLGERGSCPQTVGDGFMAAAPLECVHGLIVEAAARWGR